MRDKTGAERNDGKAVAGHTLQAGSTGRRQRLKDPARPLPPWQAGTRAWGGTQAGRQEQTGQTGRTPVRGCRLPGGGAARFPFLHHQPSPPPANPANVASVGDGAHQTSKVSRFSRAAGRRLMLIWRRSRDQLPGLLAHEAVVQDLLSVPSGMSVLMQDLHHLPGALGVAQHARSALVDFYDDTGRLSDLSHSSRRSASSKPWS